MRTYEVAKAFSTRSQRFAVGHVVSATDDLSPHTVDDLVERGFLSGSGATDAPPERDKSEPGTTPRRRGRQ